MTSPLLRAVVVGASSLLGKELADELTNAAGANWDLALLDVGDSAGQVTAAGDEALLIQPLTPDSFAGAAVVFFAAEAATTFEYWKLAVAAGAGVVDLSGALAKQPGVTVRAPLLAGTGLDEQRLDLSTEAVVTAHAASMMLGYVAARLRSQWGERARFSATVLLPVSEQGKEGMDELHAQTVALLSFQAVPRDIYDAQVTFNLNAAFGSAARVDLQQLSGRIESELGALLGAGTAARCAFQCVQAPVFHGCSASIFLQFDERVEIAQVEAALAQPALLTVVDQEDGSPSNATANEQETMQASLRATASGAGVWLWLVADNLRLTARNAVACAGELLAMRPAAGRVQ